MKRNYFVIRYELESGACLDVDEAIDSKPDIFHGGTCGESELRAFRMNTGDMSKVANISKIQVQA